MSQPLLDLEGGLSFDLGAALLIADPPLLVQEFQQGHFLAVI